MTQIDEKTLAGSIDHTYLAATATKDDIRKHCNEAREYGFAAVCVNTRWVPLVADLLHNTPVKVASVVSLPLGADSTKIKMAQAREAIFSGADEIDMVADLASIIEGDGKYLIGQLLGMLKVCRSMRPAAVLKVIIESAALSFEQKVFACHVAQQVGVDFLKTSTGMHEAGGATVEDIKLMKEMAPKCRIKAAGGIKTVAQATAMLDAGAERIGTSSSVQIMEEFKASPKQ